MISSYNLKDQTLQKRSPVIFATNRICTGSTVIHKEDSPEFCLNRPGYYFVTFNGTLKASDKIKIQLYQNDEPVPGAVAQSSTEDKANLAFSTIIKVCPSCPCQSKTKLTFVNDGKRAVLANANVVITKLC